MKKNLVYLVLTIAVFASCSPTYKTSQTPDDVYYSPAKKIYAGDNYDSYQSSTTDDDYLRMKVQDNEKWSTIDDYDYWNDSRYYYNNYYAPYTPTVSMSIGMGYTFGGVGYYPYYSAYTPYWYNPWSSWYNPCYTVVYYKTPAVYYKPVSKYSLSTYSNHTYNNYNMPLQTGSRGSAYANTNNINTNKNNDSYYNHTQNNNSYTPSRSFSSGSSSMGGGARISGGGGRTRP